MPDLPCRHTLNKNVPYPFLIGFALPLLQHFQQTSYCNSKKKGHNQAAATLASNQ